MRIVTWNVNSMKARMPRFLTWAAARQPDVVLIQETKSTPEQWPAATLGELGYESAHLGNGRWNGVAIVSRVGLTDVSFGLDGQPDFEGAHEPRALGATCGGIRLWSLYVPNGREVGHPHYDYKLQFLAAVRHQVVTDTATATSGQRFVLMGDFNVAPRDADVWDSAAFVGSTHVSGSERAAVTEIQAATNPALADLVPRASATVDDPRPPYTFWEMRQLGFQKGRGMRIDLVLANAAFAATVTDVWVDRDTRKGDGPSDHAPVVVDLS